MTALNDNSVRFRAYTFDLGKGYELRFYEDQDKLDEWTKDIVEVAEQISITSYDPEEIELDFACFLPDMYITVLSVEQDEQTGDAHAVMMFEQGEFKLLVGVELDLITDEDIANGEVDYELVR